MQLTPLDPWIASKIGANSSRLTRSALEAYQLARLQDTIQTLRASSPFYRAHLAGCPTELTRLDDLAAFPLTTARDIQQAPLQFLCVSQGDVRRVVTLDSSGTTASPKRLFFSQADQELTLDFFHIGMSTFTQPGDRVLILLPVERPGSVGDLLAIALERLGAQGIRHGLVRDVARTLDVLFATEANVLVGVPTQVLALARAVEARRFPTPPVQNVLLTTDHVPASIANALEQAWGCTVYNHYGMTEMGLGGGVECVARRGYHLREADLLFEIVDPQTGAPVPDGTPGEVVFTTLTRQAMPLLRYRTGDISHFVPRSCSCGTCLKTLARVRSRVENVITLDTEMHLALADLDEVLFAFDPVLDFTATLEQGDNAERCLRLHLYLNGAAHDRLLADVRAALDTLPVLRSGRLALSLTVEPGGGSLPLPPGKRTLRRADD